MKHILTLAAVVFATSCFGQEDCELTYDGNGDGIVSAADLIGLLAEFGSECLPDTTFDCGETLEYQGYEYATVLIGEQCWFAENLRVESYQNGDSIPANLSNSEWENTPFGALAVYDEDAFYLETYGLLYNWYAVTDLRGLCPNGWHVSTDEEWITMEMTLGMSEAEANDIEWRGTDQGTQMKASPSDNPGWNGTNTSGFSGLTGGRRESDGNFYSGGFNGAWWTSSPSPGCCYGWRRLLADTYEDVYRGTSNPHIGYSVRCVRDDD